MKRLLLSVCVAFGLAQAATLPYQGLASDSKGNPKADASYKVDFSLYSSLNGVAPLWSESQKLLTHKGLVSALLGTETAIPDSLFKGSALYLGVSFDGGSEGGRVLLGTTAWATASGKSNQADSARAAHLADSAKSVVGLKDSVGALRSSLADSTKALRDTVTNLKATIAGLNTTIALQSQALNRQGGSLTSLLTYLLPDTVAPWKTAITYGALLDSRDGQVYRTVVIGTQTWMAQNLNYRTDSSYCYNNDTANCSLYGRLYKWGAAMGLKDSCLDTLKSCLNQVALNMQGACPNGWHVPSSYEWLLNADTSYSRDGGDDLKAYSRLWMPNQGNDISGFRALPGGYRLGGVFGGVNTNGTWWGIPNSDSNGWLLSVAGSRAHASKSPYSYWYILRSLRCLQD
jgi:uncharacterized protein (TIGR02145 family)